MLEPLKLYLRLGTGLERFCHNGGSINPCSSFNFVNVHWLMRCDEKVVQKQYFNHYFFCNFSWTFALYCRFFLLGHAELVRVVCFAYACGVIIRLKSVEPSEVALSPAVRHPIVRCRFPLPFPPCLHSRASVWSVVSLSMTASEAYRTRPS